MRCSVPVVDSCCVVVVIVVIVVVFVVVAKQPVPPEVLADRKAFIDTLPSECRRVCLAVKGYALSAAAGDTSADPSPIPLPTVDEVLTGDAALAMHSEAVTDRQRVAMDGVKEEWREQDDVLDLISVALEGLTRLAHTLGDEVARSNDVIDDVVMKVDDGVGHLERVNDRMKDTLTKVCVVCGLYVCECVCGCVCVCACVCACVRVCDPHLCVRLTVSHTRVVCMRKQLSVRLLCRTLAVVCMCMCARLCWQLLCHS